MSIASSNNTGEHKTLVDSVSCGNLQGPLLSALKYSPEGILIEDTDGRIIFTNDTFHKLWHLLLHSDVPAQQLNILVSFQPLMLHPEKFREHISRISDTADAKNKFEVECADGRYIDFYCTPLLDEENHPIGRIWFIHEITERKKVEHQLRQEKQTLEKYFEVIGRIVLVIDKKGKILYLNNRGHVLLEYHDGELIGKNWITDVLAKNKNYTLDIFLESVTNPKGESAYFEYSLVTKTGKPKFITWGSTAIKDKTGTVQSYLCTGEDISDLKKAEIDIFHLKQLDQLKDEFLNIVAHELKTPLTSIIALSDLMKSKKSEIPESVSAYPAIIFEEGIRLKNVVKRILTVTRFESGKDIIHLEPVSVNTFFQSLIPELQTLNQKKKYTLQMSLPPDDIHIETDKAQISEVIINLVDNAVKYGPENQEITVQVTHDEPDDMVIVKVSDHGQGIPPESIHRLFNKFSQLEPSLSRSQEGTGLGLYICKLIVERLGGKISVESTVGTGSTFMFTLPIKRVATDKKENA